MPTPIGHTLGGYAAARLVGSRFDAPPKLPLWLLVALSLAPDSDFIPGLMVGNFDVFHHHATHSLLAALALGVLVGLFYRMRGQRFVPFFAAAAAAVASHLLLDMLTPAGGLELLWPVEVRIGFPFAIFDSVSYHAELPFPESILRPGNLRTVTLELLLLVPAALLAWRVSRRRQAVTAH